MSSRPVHSTSRTTRDSVRRHCPACGERVTITAHDNWRCPECTSAFCPYCKTSVRDRCEHVVASITDDGGWEYSPFEHAPLPLVPRELRRIEPTTEDWQEVFGEKDSEVIADAYTDYRSLVEQLEWEHERRLFLLLIERQRLECESSSWLLLGGPTRCDRMPAATSAR